MDIKQIKKIAAEDIDDVAQQVVDMAFDSEQKVLDLKLVKQSINFVFLNQRLGEYFIHLGQQINSVGSLMIYKEINIYKPNLIIWLASVNVKAAYRRQGVFTRLFNEVERLSLEEKAPIKLYAEVENYVAHAVYEKLNMLRCNQIVYEDDLMFNPVRGQIVDNQDMVSDLATQNNIEEIMNFVKQSKSLSNNTFDDETEEQLQQNLLKSLADTAKEGSIILTKLNGEIAMMTSYFTEFSDWRFGVKFYQYLKKLIIWVYDCRVSEVFSKDRELLNQLIQHLIICIKLKLQVSLRVLCIRFITKNGPDAISQELEKIGWHKAHYYIYSKNPQ